jgi:adenylylsulfate reductase, subunit A
MKSKVVPVTTDVLVVGGGIAGCNAALAAAERGARVVVMDKGKIERSGDLGGGVDHFLAFLGTGRKWDTREAFLDWVWEAGGGTGDPAIIDAVCCSELKEAIDRMVAVGIPLTQPDGSFYRTGSFGMPGPYFINFNGKKIKPSLARRVRKLGCRVLDKVMVLELMTQDGRVTGAFGFHIRTGDLYVVQAKAVVVSTGDASRLFQHGRLNPFNTWASPFNTGDGQVMAFHAGATLSNLEYLRMSIVPKGFAAAGFNAFMGMGCRLMNSLGEYFMDARYPDASRNMAVFCVLEELRAGRGPLYMDCRHLEPAALAHLNTTLGYDKDTLPDYLHQRGEHDLKKQLIEIDVSDASQGGTTSVTGAGIRIGKDSESTVPGLFAAGNCSDHNRGLWAATTGGYHAGKAAAQYAGRMSHGGKEIDKALEAYEEFASALARKKGLSYREVEDMIRKVMHENVGTMRSEKGLETGLSKLDHIGRYLDDVKAGDLHELMRVAESRSLLLVGKLMARAALYRKESRMKPFHCRLDYPETDETNWRGLVLIRNEAGGPGISFQKLTYKRP